MYCSICGTPAHDHDRFCTKCGQGLHAAETGTTGGGAPGRNPHDSASTSRLLMTAAEPGGAASACFTAALARPWPRYWARSFDLMLFSVLAACLLRTFFPAALGPDQAPVIGGIILLPFALLFDALGYGIFGNTPGKWLAGIRICDIAGNRIPRASYLRRNFRMYAPGLALGIPLIALFTLTRSYNKAKRGQLLSWDLDRESRSLQIKPGAWRPYATAVTYVLMFFALMALEITVRAQPTPQEEIAAAVSAVNKDAPRMVNRVIRFDGAQQGPGLAIQYDYSVLNVSASQADPAIVTAYYQGTVRPRLVKFVCTSPVMQEFREVGATFRYRYLDRSGALLSTISIPTSGCH